MRTLFLGSTVVLSACATAGPDVAVLQGRWGGKGIELEADAAEVIVTLPCVRIRVAAAIPLQADGRSSGAGVSFGASSLPANGRTVPLTGSKSGSLMTITLGDAFKGPAFILRQGSRGTELATACVD